MTPIDRRSLPRFRPDQWLEVEQFFAEARRNVMPHELVNATSLDAEDALLLLNGLAMQQAATIYLLVYHRGCSHAPITKQPATLGWPTFPIFCSFCDEAIGATDVDYGLMASIGGALRFENE